MDSKTSTAALAAVAAAMLFIMWPRDDDRVPVVEIYTAEWCPHCRAMQPEIETLIMTSYSESYRVVTYTNGTPEAEKMEKKRHVEAYPTVLITEGGDVTKRMEGKQTAEDVKKALGVSSADVSMQGVLACQQQVATANAVMANYQASKKQLEQKRDAAQAKLDFLRGAGYGIQASDVRSTFVGDVPGYMDGSGKDGCSTWDGGNIFNDNGLYARKRFKKDTACGPAYKCSTLPIGPGNAWDLMIKKGCADAIGKTNPSWGTFAMASGVAQKAPRLACFTDKNLSGDKDVFGIGVVKSAPRNDKYSSAQLAPYTAVRFYKDGIGSKSWYYANNHGTFQTLANFDDLGFNDAVSSLEVIELGTAPKQYKTPTFSKLTEDDVTFTSVATQKEACMGSGNSLPYCLKTTSRLSSETTDLTNAQNDVKYWSSEIAKLPVPTVNLTCALCVQDNSVNCTDGADCNVKQTASCSQQIDNESKAIAACTARGGTYDATARVCNVPMDACTKSGGTWDAKTSRCSNPTQECQDRGGKYNATTNMCEISVDCQVGDWGDWGTCDATGNQKRTRAMIMAAAYGGVACPAMEDTRACAEAPAPTPASDAPATTASVPASDPATSAASDGSTPPATGLSTNAKIAIGLGGFAVVIALIVGVAIANKNKR